MYSFQSSTISYSSVKTPCPVCGRTKDGDCRILGSAMVLCHTHRDDVPGETRRGHDGQVWAYTGPSSNPLWGTWVIDKPIAPAPQKKIRPAGKREFVYHDADGQPVVKVVRHDDQGGKKIYQQRWNGSGWASGGIDQVADRIRLYRIADACRLTQETGHPIFLVEGETCAEALLKLGIPATTSIGGAGKWRKYGHPNYIKDLRGHKVVLCPDCDESGLEHMMDIEKSLRENGIEIAGWLLAPPNAPWSELPAKGGLDVADWLETGATLEQILAAVQQDPPAQDPKPELPATGRARAAKKESVAKLLVRLALELGSLWHDSSGAGWIDFTVNGVRQTTRIRSKRFQDFLSKVLWEHKGLPVNSEAWSQAVGTLEGLARFDHPEREAFLRVGQHEGSIYIDLGRPDWQIVEVAAGLWRLIPYDECPIRFYRSECQLPLPTPTHRGSLEDLWRLLNFKAADRPLVLGWLLSCLVPGGAKPILALSGEKGSGKSSAATLLKRLTDPTRADKITAVGDPRQMAAMAASRWVLCFDNLTYLSSEQQDLLCCVSTGAGFSHRTLYTNLEETFLEYRRPQILTGVDLVPTRSDLLDRCLIVRLERIPEEERLPEAELEALTTELLPGIYGALLDLLSTALTNLPTTRPAKLPRMADFAALGIAAGIPGFMDAYRSSIEAGCQAAIEANPIAAGILALLETTGGNWQGTATELVKQLQESDPSSREFQRLSSGSLGRRLSRTLKTDLEAVGVSVDFARTGRQRTIILAKVAPSHVPSEVSQKPSQTSQASKRAPDKDRSSDTSQSQVSPRPNHVSPPSVTAPAGDRSGIPGDTWLEKVSPPKPAPGKGSDTSDVCDGSPAAYLANQEPVELDDSELIEIPDEEVARWCKP